MDSDILLNTRELAVKLNIDYRSLLKIIKKGTIIPIHIGKSNRWDYEDVRKQLKEGGHE